MEQVLSQIPEFLSPTNLRFLLESMGITLALTFFGCGLGFLLAFFVVYARQTPGHWALPLRAAAILFVEIFRRRLFAVPLGGGRHRDLRLVLVLRGSFFGRRLRRLSRRPQVGKIGPAVALRFGRARPHRLAPSVGLARRSRTRGLRARLFEVDLDRRSPEGKRSVAEHADQQDQCSHEERA